MLEEDNACTRTNRHGGIGFWHRVVPAQRGKCTRRFHRHRRFAGIWHYSAGALASSGPSAVYQVAVTGPMVYSELVLSSPDPNGQEGVGSNDQDGQSSCPTLSVKATTLSKIPHRTRDKLFNPSHPTSPYIPPTSSYPPPPPYPSTPQSDHPA